MVTTPTLLRYPRGVSADIPSRRTRKHRTEHVTFPNAEGLMLAASIDRPFEAPKAWAIVAHCFTCGRKSPGASRIAKRLADHGIASLRLDFTGLGDSEGTFRLTTLSSNTTDLLSAYRYLKEREEAPTLLVGHSLGASASILAAPQMPTVKAIAVVGAPFRPDAAIKNHASDVCDPDETGTREIVIAGRQVSLGPEFLESVENFDAAAKLAELGRPLLILHAPKDSVVPFAEAIEMFQVATDDCSGAASLVCLDGADHRLTVSGSAQQVADIAAAWVTPYL